MLDWKRLAKTLFVLGVIAVLSAMGGAILYTVFFVVAHVMGDWWLLVLVALSMIPLGVTIYRCEGSDAKI